jgi:uncharacterized RDD family membrane protein YckC
VSVADGLIIDTPEQVALEMPIAGIGSRFMAIAVDTLLQIVLYLAAFFVLILVGPLVLGLMPGAGLVGAAIGPAVLVIASFCVYWGYFAAFEILWRGQTPGKRAAGIRVIKLSGRPIDATAAILRNLLRPVDFMPGLYAGGVVCMFLNTHSRRIGDLVAGTVVVHDHRADEPSSLWRPEATKQTFAAGPEAGRVTADEIIVIETYLDRRHAFSADVSDRVAEQIAGRLAERIGLVRAPGQDLDKFLEQVARQARDASRFR